MGAPSGPAYWRRQAALGIAAAFAVALSIGAAAFGACAYVASQLRFAPITPSDPYRPTDAELRASATTVPLRTKDCAALRAVYRGTGRVGAATSFFPSSNATPQGALVELRALHAALVRSERVVGAPMRQRLIAADRDVAKAEAIIIAWHGRVPQEGAGFPDSGPLSDVSTAGYHELRVAERLLGSACAGRLVPDGTTMLFGSAYAAALPTTTTTTTTTNTAQ